jgi:hypothetical protein
MNIELKNPPRKFNAGKNIELKDCGKIKLDENEQITFITDKNKKYDVVSKNWGFYATPSVNGRLKNEGFKTALIKNPHGRYYIMIVDMEKMEEFNKYIEMEESKVIEWLDEK